MNLLTFLLACSVSWAGVQSSGGSSSLGSNPTGAAGGDLTGTYPNPTVAAGAIGDGKTNLSTGAVVSGKFGDNLVGISTGAVTSGKFGDNRVSVSTGALASGTWNDTQVSLTTGAVVSGKFGDNRVSVSTGALASGTWNDTQVSLTTGATVSGKFGDTRVSISTGGIIAMNGASQLVQLNSSSQLPAVSAALLTNIPGPNIVNAVPASSIGLSTVAKNGANSDITALSGVALISTIGTTQTSSMTVTAASTFTANGSNFSVGTSSSINMGGGNFTMGAGTGIVFPDGTYQNTKPVAGTSGDTGVSSTTIQMFTGGITFTNTTFSQCVSGSSLTITTGANPILISATVQVANNTGGSSVWIVPEVDGLFVGNMTKTNGLIRVFTDSGLDQGTTTIYYTTPAQTAASHTVCLASRVDSGTGTWYAPNVGANISPMTIKEVK